MWRKKWGRVQLKCDGTRWRTGGEVKVGNWRMEWVASTLHTTSEHGVSSITTADAHTSAASSRLNWRPPPPADLNGVGSQYPSHYLGTWCIQHYYRWCAHLGCQQSTELASNNKGKRVKSACCRPKKSWLQTKQHVMQHGKKGSTALGGWAK